MQNLIIVSNASPLINIARLKLFHHLPSICRELIIPYAVFKEIVERGAGRFGDTEVSKGITSGFIIKKMTGNVLAVSALSEFLGDGESEAIVLSSELSADIILLDDNKARITAQSMGFTVMGTIGILLEFKNKNIIKKVKPFIDKAISSGFRISPEMYRKTLQHVDE